MIHGILLDENNTYNFEISFMNIFFFMKIFFCMGKW